MRKTCRMTIILAAGVVLGVCPAFADNYDPHPEGVTYTEHFRAQFHFSPASEWMNDVNSKKFDMTAVFDLKGTSSTSIDFRIAQVSFKYDIANKQMCVGLPGGKAKYLKKDLTLNPDANGILTIRMLVDWAQLEIFSAGGVFSASYHLGFAPGDSSLGLSATGGEVKLRSLTLNEVARIWPAASGDGKGN